MSKWENFKKNIGELADKTAKKTRELTDTAALKIKIANKEADRDLEYKKLGKMTYAKLKNLNGADHEKLTAKISESLENLDRILAELEEFKKEEVGKKAEKAAEKEADKKAKKPKKNVSPKNTDDDKLDVKIMEEFNAARKTADEAYLVAKQEAVEAKDGIDE